MKKFNWESTNFLVNLVKEELVRQHNKPKEIQVEEDLKTLRNLAIMLNYRRIEICIAERKK